MAESKILKCKCVSAYQDAVYGKGMRLCNPAGKGQDGRSYRCTICGAVIDVRDTGKKK